MLDKLLYGLDLGIDTVRPRHALSLIVQRLFAPEIAAPTSCLRARRSLDVNQSSSKLFSSKLRRPTFSWDSPVLR